MSDHSDALTPEIKEFIERARQFQEWADENGFGAPAPINEWDPDGCDSPNCPCHKKIIV